jgi:hypothetical protein
MSVILAGAIDGCIHNCIIWGTIIGIASVIWGTIIGIASVSLLPLCWCIEAVWGFWDGCYGGIINAITEICCD